MFPLINKYFKHWNVIDTVEKHTIFFYFFLRTEK